MFKKLREWAVFSVITALASVPVNAAPVTGNLTVNYNASFDTTVRTDGSFVFNIGGVWNFSNTLTSTTAAAGGWVLSSAVDVFENISAGAIPAGSTRYSRRFGAGSAESLTSEAVVPGASLDFGTAFGAVRSARTGSGTASGNYPVGGGGSVSFTLSGLGGSGGTFGVGVQGANFLNSLGALGLLANTLGLDESLLFPAGQGPQSGQIAGTKTLAAIPLPAALPLLLGGLGALGLLGLRRRRAISG